MKTQNEKLKDRLEECLNVLHSVKDNLEDGTVGKIFVLNEIGYTEKLLATLEQEEKEASDLPNFSESFMYWMAEQIEAYLKGINDHLVEGKLTDEEIRKASRLYVERFGKTTPVKKVLIDFCKYREHEAPYSAIINHEKFVDEYLSKKH